VETQLWGRFKWDGTSRVWVIAVQRIVGTCARGMLDDLGIKTSADMIYPGIPVWVLTHPSDSRQAFIAHTNRAVSRSSQDTVTHEGVTLDRQMFWSAEVVLTMRFPSVGSENPFRAWGADSGSGSGRRH
jgi:hypothetical protein